MSDFAAVLLALSAAVGAIAGAPLPWPLGAVVVALALALRRPVLLSPALLCLGVAILTSSFAARAWDGLRPPTLGRWEGTATLVGDPSDVQGALRVVVRIGGKRVEAWARGGAAGGLHDRLAGERVQLTGQVERVPSNLRKMLGQKHISARMNVSSVGSWAPGDPSSRLANGLRRTLLSGTESMPRESRALFAGFVLGDDREESVEVADDFKASGLSHLLVVSGENVAFTLAVFAPLLKRLSLRSRLAVGLAILFLFGVLTRWEPSVMRAEAMAALSLVAIAWGRPVSPIRLLALAATAVLLVDPLLVGSVGFLLSVGACAGIAVIARPLERALPGPRWLATPAAVTVAAQAGVAPVLVPVFGGLPVASLPANLVALPAAAPIMSWGVAAGLPAGLIGGPIANLLHTPTHLFIWWVAVVARWAGRLPLGVVGMVPATLLGAAIAAAAGAKTRERRWLQRLGIAGAICVLVAAAAPALRPPPSGGDVLTEGARLWRDGGATIVVVDGVRSPQQLLASMHPANVRSLDALVVTRTGSMAARSVEPLMARLSPRLLLAPETGRLRGAVVPQAGSTYHVGPLAIVVDSVKPRLQVRIVRDQPPPGPESQ